MFYKNCNVKERRKDTRTPNPVIGLRSDARCSVENYINVIILCLHF